MEKCLARKSKALVNINICIYLVVGTTNHWVSDRHEDHVYTGSVGP